MTSDTELAWAAGFFDGEGSTSVNHTTRCSFVAVSIDQVDRRSLDRFVAAVEVGEMRGLYTYEARPAPIHRLRYTGIRAVAVLGLLWPWLGEAKREQVLRVGSALLWRP